MKLKQLQKQPRRDKLQVIVDGGVTANLAALKEKFDACGYEWDFDKRANRWVKGFIEEANKALSAVAEPSAPVLTSNVANFVPNQQT